MRPQGGVEGGRSHGVDLMVGTLGTTDADAATDDGDPGGVDELKSPRNTDGTGDQGGTTVTSIEGGTGELKDRGGARGKVKPDGAEGAGRSKSDQDGAGGTREPDGAILPVKLREGGPEAEPVCRQAAVE